MKKDKGYTLIEVIIVIAIMAILSGMAFVTLSIIRQAKANAASASLDNQITNLWVQTKAISAAKQPDAADVAADYANGVDTSTVDYAKSHYPLCMKIEKNTADKDIVKNGDAREGSYSIIFGYNQNGTFVANANGDIAANLSEVVKIVYEPSDSSQVHNVTAAGGGTSYEDNFLIEFSKSDGSVRYGAGDYRIYDSAKNISIMTLHVDPTTGNHYAK